MYTYQDFEEIEKNESSIMQFVRSAITEHKGTKLYDTAKTAEMYDAHQNKTILEYKKLLYTLSGEAVPDNYSANYKLPSNFFNRFVVQETQYLLGNGITWQNESTKEKLGDDFDSQLQEVVKSALVGGVAFGFFNLDHLEIFPVTEYVPLYDENNGSLRAGIRFWQVASDKPLRATFYEEDGYTEYLWNDDGVGTVLKEKRPYKQKIRTSEADGTEIYDGENYPTFPIVPIWGNKHKQSELVGLREEIDAYDLIQSGFANDLDDVSQIYWTIQNADGMDDVDLARFLDHMKRVKAAVVEDEGARAEPHTIDIPHAAREALLERLERTMYKDYMALNTETIAGGAVTATQIRAAYEPMNSKSNQLQDCVVKFLKGLLKVADIDDKPTFTRTALINEQETVQTILMAAQYLPQEYVTEKILTILGDADKVDEIQKKLDAENQERMQQAMEMQGISRGEEYEEGQE